MKDSTVELHEKLSTMGAELTKMVEIYLMSQGIDLYEGLDAAERSDSKLAQ